MQRDFDPFRPRLDGGGSRASRPAGTFAISGAIGKAVGVAVGVVAVIAAMAMSIIALGAIVVVGAVGGAWFWWRTRDLRLRLKAEVARMQAMAGQPATAARDPFAGASSAGRSGAPGRGEVLDGDFIRERPQAGDRADRTDHADR